MIHYDSVELPRAYKSQGDSEVRTRMASKMNTEYDQPRRDHKNGYYVHTATQHDEGPTPVNNSPGSEWDEDDSDE